jgi:sugar phosphate isomerase/epimerase
MKLAIDSYTYHRYFGDWYAGLQDDPGARLTVFEFLDRACAHGVAGVSLEACFLPSDDAFIDRLREALDGRDLERVWAWGHPNGLGSGTDATAAQDLAHHLRIAQRLGARVMRICGGGRRTRPASWAEHKRGLVELLRPLVDEAQRLDVVIAIENHIDLLADEMVELLETIDSPWLGVCFDTANNLRMFEDPVAVARKLAPWARATHVKDVTAQRGDPKTFAFWPSVPLGRGLIDLPAILALLHEARFHGLLALEIDYLAPAYVEAGEDAAVGESLAWLREQVDRIVKHRVTAR